MIISYNKLLWHLGRVIQIWGRCVIWLLLDSDAIWRLNHEVWGHSLGRASSTNKRSFGNHFLLVLVYRHLFAAWISGLRFLCAGEHPPELFDCLLPIDPETCRVISLRCRLGGRRLLQSSTISSYLALARRICLFQNEKLLLSRKAVEGFRLCDLVDNLVVLVHLILCFLLVLFLEICFEILVRVITLWSLGYRSSERIWSDFSLLDDGQHVINLGIALIRIYPNCLIRIYARLSFTHSWISMRFGSFIKSIHWGARTLEALMAIRWISLYIEIYSSIIRVDICSFCGTKILVMAHVVSLLV